VTASRAGSASETSVMAAHDAALGPRRRVSERMAVHAELKREIRRNTRPAVRSARADVVISAR
jgi:hypothetical protein